MTQLASNIPAGFKLDDDSSELPPGFKLDSAPTAAPADVPAGFALDAPAAPAVLTGDPLARMERLASTKRQIAGQAPAESLPQSEGFWQNFQNFKQDTPGYSALNPKVLPDRPGQDSIASLQAKDQQQQYEQGKQVGKVATFRDSAVNAASGGIRLGAGLAGKGIEALGGDNPMRSVTAPSSAYLSGATEANPVSGHAGAFVGGLADPAFAKGMQLAGPVFAKLGVGRAAATEVEAALARAGLGAKAAEVIAAYSGKVASGVGEAAIVMPTMSAAEGVASSEVGNELPAAGEAAYQGLRQAPVMGGAFSLLHAGGERLLTGRNPEVAGMRDSGYIRNAEAVKQKAAADAAQAAKDAQTKAEAEKQQAIDGQYNLPAGPKSVVGPRPKFDAPFEDNRPAVVGPTPQFDTPFEDNRPAVVGPKFTPNDLQKAPEAQDANAPGYTLTKQGKSEVGPKFDQEALTKTPEAQPANDVLTQNPYGFKAAPLEGNKPVAEPLDIYGRPASDATSPLQPPDGGDSPTPTQELQTRQKPANGQNEASVKPEGPAIAESPSLKRTAQDTPDTVPASPSPSDQGEASTPVAIYGGKEVPANNFKDAANRVSANLKTGEHGYVRDSNGKLYEIASDSKLAKPVSEMRTAGQRDVAKLEERIAKAQSPNERDVLTRRLDEMKKGQTEAATAPTETPAQSYDLLDSAGNKVSEHLTEAAASSARDRLGDPRARIKGRGRQGGFVDVGLAADAAKGVAKAGANLTNETAGAALRGFSEDLPDALARHGKEKSGEASLSGRRAIDKGKQLFGSVSPQVDSAVDAVRMMGKHSSYLQEIAPSKSGTWGIRRIVDAVEGGNVPEFARAAVDKVRTANLAIGKMAEPYIEGFKATGKFQRNWTNYGFDIIRSGGGKAWDTLTQAYAEANGKSPEGVRAYFKSLKAELDAPGGEASYRRINQEFTREFPKAPTDIKVNGSWVPVLHANPVEYLQTSAQRSAMRAGVLSEPSLSGEGLKATRAGVAAEGGETGPAFDRMLRSLHGIPEGVVGPKPGTASRAIVDAGKRVATDVLKPLYLSGSAISNIPESVAGAVPQTFGLRNAIRGAMRMKSLRADLESEGAINKAVYDWSVDPNGFTKSALRIFRNGVTKLSGQRGINELQELHAAATAKVVAERLQGGKMGKGEQAKLTEHFANMGFERARAEALAQGKASPADYQAMVRRAAAYTTGGNKLPAEGSRFQNNRALNQLLPFQGYSIKQVNLLRKNVGSLYDAIQSGDRTRIVASGRNFGRFVTGTTLQGAAVTALLAMASGGTQGLKIAANEAKDEPGKFLLDSFLYRGIGGPLSVASQMTSRPVNAMDTADINAGSTFPGSQIQEAIDITTGKGNYKDQSALERAKTYFTKRVPGGRILNTIVGTMGAGDSDPATDSSITAFYRWRRAELGVSQTKTSTYDSEDEQQTRAFRLHMRRAADDIKATRDPTKNIEAAIGVKGADLKKLTSSLQGRKILKGVGGAKLTPEQITALKNRIGEDAFKRIKNYDDMLDGWAHALTRKPDSLD